MPYDIRDEESLRTATPPTASGSSTQPKRIHGMTFRHRVIDLYRLEQQLQALTDRVGGEQPLTQPELDEIIREAVTVVGKAWPILFKLGKLDPKVGDGPLDIKNPELEEFYRLQERIPFLQERIFDTVTLLQSDDEAVINNDRKEAPHAIVEAQTPTQPEPPKAETELAAIQQRGLVLAQTAQVVGSLGLEGVDIQVQIAGLHELATRCEQLARNLGMQALSEGNLTQRQLSRLLDVHELTVGRWVKATQREQEKDQ